MPKVPRNARRSIAGLRLAASSRRDGGGTASGSTLPQKVDEMSTEMQRQFGKWEGLELGERVTHLERQAFNGHFPRLRRT